jgi:hypothetical protein
MAALFVNQLAYKVSQLHQGTPKSKAAKVTEVN